MAAALGDAQQRDAIRTRLLAPPFAPAEARQQQRDEQQQQQQQEQEQEPEQEQEQEQEQEPGRQPVVSRARPPLVAPLQESQHIPTP